MAASIDHASVEGAQHGAKNLADFLAYARKSGASGAQPSNYMLQDKDGGFQSAKEFKATFAKAKVKLDGASMHCPFCVHTSAWTHTQSLRPFTGYPSGYWKVGDRVHACHEEDFGSHAGMPSRKKESRPALGETVVPIENYRRGSLPLRVIMMAVMISAATVVSAAETRVDPPVMSGICDLFRDIREGLEHIITQLLLLLVFIVGAVRVSKPLWEELRKLLKHWPHRGS